MTRRRRYAKGRKSRAICERSGFEIPYKYITEEPGTNLLVDKRWSDGMYNRVDHPQNFSPRGLADGRRLKYATGDENFNFVEADFVETRLLNSDGQPLLTKPDGNPVLSTLTRIAFNSLKKVC